MKYQMGCMKYFHTAHLIHLFTLSIHLPPLAYLIKNNYLCKMLYANYVH